jgi:hypothetical protein
MTTNSDQSYRQPAPENLKEVKRSRWARHYYLANPAIAEVKPVRQKKG